MLRPVHLVTNALIALVEREERGLRSFVLRVNQAKRRLVTSEITVAELLVKPVKSEYQDPVLAYEGWFSEENGIVLASSMTRGTMRRSAEIRARFGGRLVDSIQVATAEMLGREAIVSSDERLRLPDGLAPIATSDLNDIR